MPGERPDLVRGEPAGLEQLLGLQLESRVDVVRFGEGAGVGDGDIGDPVAVRIPGDQVGAAVRTDHATDAYGGAEIEGTVESIASATGAKFALLPPDNATGNFTKVVQRVPVRIHITKGLDANRPLRPGMSVTVHVNTK